MEIIGAQKAFIPDEKEQKIRIPKSTAELAKLSAVTAPKSINGVVMNDAEYAFLSRMAAKSDDPEGVLIKGAAALTISRNTSLPVSYCLSNLDEISKAQVGTPAQSEQAWLASIVNSYKIGDLTVQRGNIGKQYANAERAGQDITELAKQMQDIDAQIESLKDYAPRTWATKALQIVAQSLPYTLNVSAVSTGAGLAAKGVTAAIPGIADDIAVGAVRWITGIAGAMKTKDVLWGSMYYDMVQDGVDKDVAYWMSKASGYLSGAIEMALGSTIKGITKAVGVSGGSIADKLISRMYANGSLGKVGAFFTRWVANGIEEGSEEFVESIKDQILENWAYTLSDIDVPDSKKVFSKETLGSAAEEFIWGAASGMILGLPADIINTGADAKAAAQESERLKEQAAAIPSKEAYVNLNKDTSVLSYMNETERKQTLADIWEKQQTAQAAQTADDNSELKTIDIDDIDQPENVGEELQNGQVVEGIASSQPVKPIQRLSDGRLRTQESDTYRTNTDGSETHTLKLGSVGTSQRYGTVDYTINGNEISIDSIKTKQGYEEIVADAVTELSRRYEGYNLSWDPETASQQKIKAELIEANPRGKESGLNYYDKITDTDAAIRLASGIRKTFPKLSKDEATVAGQILELVAKSQGKTTAQWMTDNFQGFQQKDLGEGKKGAIEFVETEKGARAIVYASENADFSTFTHEVFHVARRTSSQSQSLASAMQEASRTDEFKRYIKEHEQIIHMSAEEAVEALKKFSDSWTVPQEELAATLFESYLRDGATASPKLRNLFQKIADWFVRIYNKIKSTVKMDDRIVSVFDQILGGDTEVSRQFKEATQEADSVNGKVDSESKEADNTIYQSENAAQQEYDQVHDQYNGTDKWLKAPNGKDTNLTERQWVQVRTPAFKAWFGDWINDPENASKVVDENGEPLVVYHHTSKNFTVFNRGKGLSGDGVYFSYYPLAQFGPIQIQAFLDIRNPITRKTEIKGMREINDAGMPTRMISDVLERFPQFDGVMNRSELTVKNPSQIKSATDNSGTFDGEDTSILFQTEDKRYMKAIKSGDMETAQRIVDDVARKKGYTSDNDYRMMHQAPHAGTDLDLNIIQLADSSAELVPKDYWDHPEWYGVQYEAGGYESFQKIKRIIDLAKTAKNPDHLGIIFYRAVPADLKEGHFRNGDWITPSKEYAKLHGETNIGKYRIISQFVSIKNAYWNADSINEWGFDDGNSYAYKDTKNNRKLTDVITRDDEGNIIPPSKRFNHRNDRLFQSLDPEQEIIDEAKGFEDLDDFISYAEAMLDIDESTAREAFEKAHEDKGFGENLSDDEKDDKFIQMMETDKSINEFVSNIRTLSYGKWAVDSGQMRGLEESDVKYYETARRFETEASPFIQAIAKGTKDVSEESRKKIRSMLINNARMYRDLYAAIINDDTMAAVQYDEFLPNIDEPAVSGISIMDRKRMSDKIEAEGLKKKILSGTETLRGETEKVIKQLDLDISNLEDEVKAAQAETDRLKSQMSSVERDYLLGVQEKRKARQALDRTNRLIRARMDSGRRIPAESITKQRSLQDKIDLLDRQIAGWHAQNKDNAKTLRMAATEKKNQAIEDLKAEIRTKEQERREARKIRDYKQQLASAITEKPSDAVDYEYAQKINAIRSLVDPNFRAGFIRYNDKKYSIAEFREIVEKEGLLSSDLTDYQIARLTKKSLDDWTISELEEMAEKVSRLREEGRQIWQAKVDKRAFEAQALQNAILREILENKHYKAPDDISASIDYQRRRRSLKTKWKAGIGKTYNMDRKAQMVDGDKKGVAHDLLVRKKRETQENELRSMSRRQDPITKLMKDLGVSVDDLYKTVDIALDGKQYKFTYSDLVYGINAQKEERNYRAFAYGDLVSDQDKIDLFHDSVAIERLGDDRNRQFISQAKLHLANEEKLQKVFDAIEKDLQEQATRLNEVSIREYNKGIDIQDYYMPIYRKDFNGTEISQQLQDDIFNRNAGKSATTPKHGSMTSRIDISADHQMPTAMDYFGTWAKSLAQQEHIISTLEYTRELNRVFKNLGSKDLRSNITSTFGDGMMADIDQYINEVANPSVFTDVQGLNSALKMLRGGLYTGYLGFKMSSIVLQGLSSPMPFLSEVNPIQLIAGLFKMTASPAKTWNFICDQSKFMANRSMHPVIDEIKHRAETSTDSKFKRGYNKALEIGTQGLEIIDRWAVAGGWIACYEKKLAALENQNSAESMAEAARYADEVVYATQPLGDLTELSPLFKSQSEFARAFTQFQTALNVIWQNVTYDAPKQLKRHQFRKAVGIYAGYALAGVLLTAVMDGFDDDDDEMDKLRKLVFGATTQFADSFPLIGGIVENLSFALITGERPPQYVSSMFPALDKLSSGVVSLSQGDVDKALSKIGEGAALATGLPVSGLKELEAMFTDGFHPETLLGRRK